MKLLTLAFCATLYCATSIKVREDVNQHKFLEEYFGSPWHITDSSIASQTQPQHKSKSSNHLEQLHQDDEEGSTEFTPDFTVQDGSSDSQ